MPDMTEQEWIWAYNYNAYWNESYEFEQINQGGFLLAEKKTNWFFRYRFSWFDLIMITIIVQIIDFVISHLSWQ